ncbi:hypothetical protein [Pseudomonas protegens]|nr:hypothetical protein [Pseudomonas protegens]
MSAAIEPRLAITGHGPIRGLSGDGQMVDAPVLQRARRLLALA